ncbi:MAG: 30S ribosomal protein S6e, partial [Candidatus Bathyarchaeota archaeon]|nr:30S ribosomal protein S6e [Candidatus Bathyarchaeota archaeon]
NVVLSGGAGFSPKKKGERKRKAVRGSTITDEIVQINMKIVEKPAAKATEAKAQQAAK